MKLATIAMLGLTISVSSAIDAEKLADAIYRAEGGLKAKVPYGILSVKTRDAGHARRVCLNTIRNNHCRWQKAGQPGEFVDYLGNVYCPKSADPVGNGNWRRNVKAIMKKGKQ